MRFIRNLMSGDGREVQTSSAVAEASHMVQPTRFKASLGMLAARYRELRVALLAAVVARLERRLQCGGRDGCV